MFRKETATAAAILPTPAATVIAAKLLACVPWYSLQSPTATPGYLTAKQLQQLIVDT